MQISPCPTAAHDGATWRRRNCADLAIVGLAPYRSAVQLAIALWLLAAPGAVVSPQTATAPAPAIVKVEPTAKAGKKSASIKATKPTKPMKATKPTKVAPPPAPVVVPKRIADRRLTLYRRELGELTPKSLVSTKDGAVFAQNMIYKRSVSVFDHEGNHIADIAAKAPRSLLELPEDKKWEEWAKKYKKKLPQKWVWGAPVEAAVHPDGKRLFVSNYYIQGAGPTGKVTDDCKIEKPKPSFVWEIDIATLSIVRSYPVGVTPKFLAITHDGKHMLVTNWCGPLSVVDIDESDGITPTRSVKVGSFPRGIAIAPDDSVAYVASMGRSDISVVDLESLEVVATFEPGKGPRHLLIGPDGQLWVSLSHTGEIVVMDRASGEIIAKVRSGKDARSMAFSSDGSALYVGNYAEDSLSVIDTKSFKVVQKIATGPSPIGVAFEPIEERVWVSCYVGSVRIYDTKGTAPHKSAKPIAFVEAKRFPK